MPTLQEYLNLVELRATVSSLSITSKRKGHTSIIRNMALYYQICHQMSVNYWTHISNTILIVDQKTPVRCLSLLQNGKKKK